MKLRAMDKIELNYIIEELKIVEKGFFRKAYLNEDLFKIKTNKGSIMVKLGKAIWRDDKKVDNNSAFADKLRKELNNKYIESINLKEGDRLVVMEFNDYYLFIELFSKGNIILTDKSFNVVSSYKKIKGDGNYEFKVQPFSFEYYLKNMPEKPLGASLSFFLGKRYKDYILKKLNINEKILTKDVNKEEIENIEKEINNILAKPSFSIEKEKSNAEKPIIKDFSLIKDLLESPESVSSLSEACSLYYLQKEVKEDLKYLKTLEKMKERINEYEKEEKELEKAIKIVKSNIMDFDLLLQSIRKNSELNEFKKKLGVNIEVNKKEKKVVIGFPNSNESSS